MIHLPTLAQIKSSLIAHIKQKIKTKKGRKELIQEFLFIIIGLFLLVVLIGKMLH